MSADKKTRERYRQPAPSLNKPATSAQKLALALEFGFGLVINSDIAPISFYTDGWFLWTNAYQAWGVLNNAPIPDGFINTTGVRGVPSGAVVAIRALDTFKYIHPKKILHEISPSGRGAAWRHTQQIFFEVLEIADHLGREDFKIRSVKGFDREHIEMVLIDLDMWQEEHTTEENKGIIPVIKTANFVLENFILNLEEKWGGFTKENPSWVRDEKIWERAKKVVLSGKKKYDEPYAVITTIYKKMGGRIK